MLDNIPIPVSVSCAVGTDPIVPFRSFELFNEETDVQLDLVLKGQLSNLQDREVLTNCRGPRLQTFPSGFGEFDAAFLAELARTDIVGEITAVALAPNGGVLGEDTCVAAQLRQSSNFSCRHDGKDLKGDHNVVASVKVVRREGDETSVICKETIAKLDNDTIAEDDVTVIWEQECEIGFECFEACPDAVLSAPPTAQPSIYRMTDIQFNSSALEDGDEPPPVDRWCLQLIADTETKTSATDKFAPTDESTYYFSCEGGLADVQVRIRYDLDSLDGRIAAINYSSNDQPQVGFANVDIKGTVRQVWPEECNGTLMFVEGTLIGGVSFDPVGNETPDPGKENTTRFAPAIADLGPGGNRTGILLPETFVTSSVPIGNMQYAVLNASDECDQSAAQRLTYRRDGFTDQGVGFFSMPELEIKDSWDSEDNETVLELNSFFRVTEEGRNISEFTSSIAGRLTEVCDIGIEGVPAVQIQCLPREPIVVDSIGLFTETDVNNINTTNLTMIEGIDLTRIGDIELSTIARVLIKDGDDVNSTLRLSVPYSLACSDNDIERINQETDGRGGFIVRTIPLTADVARIDTGDLVLRVEQDCPVLLICEDAKPTPGPMQP